MFRLTTRSRALICGLAAAVLSTSAATAIATATPAGSPDQIPVERVNAGGPSIEGSPNWGADRRSNRHDTSTDVGSEFFLRHSVDMSHPSVPDGTPEQVFRHVRVDGRAGGGDLKWELPAPQGTSAVSLYFVEYNENFINRNSRRVDVFVNGKLVEDGLDIYGVAGSLQRGFVRTYPASPVNGEVTVRLGHDRKVPAIAGIELLSELPQGGETISISETGVDKAGPAPTPPAAEEPEPKPQPEPEPEPEPKPEPKPAPPAQPTTTTTTAAPAPAPAPAPAKPAARKTPSQNGSIVQWSDCTGIVELTDRQLDIWADRGTAAWVCMSRHLPGMGASFRWTADTSKAKGSSYSLQERIQETRIVQRMAARDMDIYLGVYLSNYHNTDTPLGNWMRDHEWNRTVLPAFSDLAGAANAMGFAGLAFDEELYQQRGGVYAASWRWNAVNGNGANWSQAEVRATVTRRGRQIMGTVLAAFPGVKIIDYGARMPGTWGELVQEEVNGSKRPYAGNVHHDLWAGLLSVPGYEDIYFMDAHFYKGVHLKASWATALDYNANSHTALFSGMVDNWDYAADRVHVSPFVWVGSGSIPYERARSVKFVTEQLIASYQLDQGQLFANYLYGSVDRFDYRDYEGAFREAKQYRTARDRTAPTVQVTSSSKSELRGTATDNHTIRSIEWRRGNQSGAASHQWVATSGNYENGYQWEAQWAVRLPAGSGPVTITVIDGDGLEASRTINP